MSTPLFDRSEFIDPLPEIVAADESSQSGKVRLRLAQRDQDEMRLASLDQLLPQHDEARIVWAAVCGLDLSRWLGEIKSVEGSALDRSSDAGGVMGLRYLPGRHFGSRIGEVHPQLPAVQIRTLPSGAASCAEVENDGLKDESENLGASAINCRSGRPKR